MNDFLVSVAVITYNSSKYVLETLESAKAQTYPNIELIISDDCSTDNTIELCEQWISKNKDRFVRTKIVTADGNTGVSANCNRAEDACKGEWVKLIAGDDMLLPNCIADFVSYVKTNPDSIFVFGRVQAFGASKLENEKISQKGFDYKLFTYKTAEGQLDRLLNWGQCLPTPTVFYNKIKCYDLGINYDERIPFIEDRPRWIQALKKNIKFNFVEKEVVKYRVFHNESLSTSKMYSEKFFRSQRLVFFYYYFPHSIDDVLYCSSVEKVVDYETKLYENYKSIVNSHAYRFGFFLLSPICWIKKLINKL